MDTEKKHQLALIYELFETCLWHKKKTAQLYVTHEVHKALTAIGLVSGCVRLLV